MTVKRITTHALLTLLAATQLAWSQTDSPVISKDNRCIFIAHAYNNAIMARNSDLPPENALAMANKELPLELRKNIVNQVYFDKNLRDSVSSSDLVYKLIQQCLHGAPKPYEPLK